MTAFRVDIAKPVQMQSLHEVLCSNVAHRARDVFDAIQTLCVSLKSQGYPVARMFRSKDMRRWCRERDI